MIVMESTCTTENDRLWGLELSPVGVFAPVPTGEVDAEVTAESLDARDAMKIPILEPQAPSVALAAWAASTSVDVTKGGAGSGDAATVLWHRDTIRLRQPAEEEPRCNYSPDVPLAEPRGGVMRRDWGVVFARSTIVPG